MARFGLLLPGVILTLLTVVAPLSAAPASAQDASPLDFSSFTAVSAVSQSAWAELLSKGRNAMPAFGEQLSAVGQRAVLEHVRSLSLGPLFQEPLARGNGVITGTVTNGTAGAPVADWPVSLAVFDSTALLEEYTTTTDAAGVYRFSELPADPALVYVARVTYPTADLPYGSEVASFQAGESILNLPITVYETTPDSASVRADRVHFIIDLEAGQLLVGELYLFSLDGNRTYIGDGTGVLRFSLPDGAQLLEINGGRLGERYLPTEAGFVDTLPLPPGQGVRQALFSYALPYSGSSLDLVRTLPYPATAVNALIVDIGQKVTSAELQNQGVRQTAGGNYINLLGQNLPPNRPITLRLTNLPTATGTGTANGSATNQVLLLVLIGLAGLGAAALVGWPLLRGRTAPAAAGATGREGLVDALARLEMAHQAGELSDADYRELRLRLKAQWQDALREEG
jgi:hypothetical protein